MEFKNNKILNHSFILYFQNTRVLSTATVAWRIINNKSGLATKHSCAGLKRHLKQCLGQQFLRNFLTLRRRKKSVFWLANKSANYRRGTELVKTTSKNQEYHLEEKEMTYQAAEQQKDLHGVFRKKHPPFKQVFLKRVLMPHTITLRPSWLSARILSII